ncbi:Galactosylceramide sulfotransferase [Thelohanellus kitauei]|uniref:Galactosylceramide sulfotransferase n=1 Tax=Thelohanellus kitauei TaxID=669202 RepID=A0A0C2JDX1_THEKT|nr:Galactosylceramide sulfotransferase [Thelohanellus kitauei]
MQIQGKVCKPKVFFLRTHKTGSTSIFNILIRAGISRGVNIALPPPKKKHFWPKSVGSDDDNRTYNEDFLLYHSILNMSSIEYYYPRSKTLYVSILREVVPQYKSAFLFFKSWKRFGLAPDINSIESMLNILKDKSTSSMNRFYHQNINFFDFGFTNADLMTDESIREAINKIDAMFDLVMIKELWEESLLLLKEMFCLTIDQIVVFNINQVKNDHPELPLYVDQMILEFNRADKMLYDHFYAKLKRMAKKLQPKEFLELRERQKYWSDSCINGRVEKIHYQDVKYLAFDVKSNLSKNTQLECILRTFNDIDYLRVLRAVKEKHQPKNL